MTATSVREVALVTADDLLARSVDGQRVERVEGVLTAMTPAGARNGRTAARLLLRIGAHAEATSAGEVLAAETGFLLAERPDTVRAPDVAFVAAERVAGLDVAGFSPVVPDLVAEVVSPGDRSSEVTQKALAWVDAGVRLVWVVDPQARTVVVHDGAVVRVLRGDDVLDGGEVLPGLSLPLGDVWPVPPP
ncbi:Uma2 family endonuclease [Pseudokineococcus lusitanus]|uniref:Uma2 family endonuclease n=1 Tax=Pseudokineococcus lusitanus TaxID=763993 RepID=A0A3N1HL73_9ACTN|nr:Uma2 family endonuclease [Pseudokineococcus lusitanus]ROP43268.1 Uma2 family endonuclease [Pseudokineococcus lusitanus]